MCSKDVQKMYNIPVTILDKTTLHTSLPIDILVLLVITNNRLFPKIRFSGWLKPITRNMMYHPIAGYRYKTYF